MRLEQDNRFYLSPLTEEEIMPALKICDECVGRNLYTAKELEHAISSENSFFYLLKTKEGDIAGYIYYYLTDVESIALQAKTDAQIFHSVYFNKKKKAGKLQSIGLKDRYRDRGLAVFMTEDMLRELSLMGIEAVFTVCWKPGGYVPLKKTLLCCGFMFLAEAEKVWQDDPELICPYCKGKCFCNAEVYYKLIGEEKENED